MLKSFFKAMCLTSVVALFAAMSFTLTSCGDDEDEPETEAEATQDYSEKISGLWRSVETINVGGTEYRTTEEYSFAADGKCSKRNVSMQGTTVTGDVKSEGTYTLVGDPSVAAKLTMELNVTLSGGKPAVKTEKVTIRIDGKDLYFTYDTGETRVFHRLVASEVN